LFAVTDEEFMQWGGRVAYIDNSGDTVIPLGKYLYYGTDTLIYYADVFVGANRTSVGRKVGITRDQKILFDLVMYDNGPDVFLDGLVRVLRNGTMGYANKYGQVVIPCVYDYGGQFNNGLTRFTFKATRYLDGDHTMIKSDEWFVIDKKGQKVVTETK
jgi:hypothetical protein